MKMKKSMINTVENVNLEWYVLNSTSWHVGTTNKFNEYPYTFYNTDIRPYNVFNNSYVREETIKRVYKFIKDDDSDLNALEAELIKILQYEEHARTEYEIQIVEWPEKHDKETNEIKMDKIDCFIQVLPNSKIYTKYVYDTIRDYVVGGVNEAN